MRVFVSTSFSLLLAATPAFADTETHRLGGTGPAYWEIPCGLPCFAMAEAAALKPNEVRPEDWKQVQTVADMQRLLDARATRLAEEQRGKAAVGGTSHER